MDSIERFVFHSSEQLGLVWLRFYEYMSSGHMRLKRLENREGSLRMYIFIHLPMEKMENMAWLTAVPSKSIKKSTYLI